MAQGLLLPCFVKNLEMEERGNEYFKILLAKSFFQDVTKDYGGNVTKCKMHKTVHELAERVSKLGNSRSLFSNGEDLGSNLLRLKSLRVLNLYKANIEVLPDSIGKLKHLRYLNVLKTRMKALPKSIGKLYNLQTLKIHYHIEELPGEIANLINLRHIYFGRYMKVSGGILRRFTNLRSLPFLKVGEETGPRIEELSGLNQLHNTLSIYGLENVGDGEEARKGNLVEKLHMRKLILGWKLSSPSHNVDNVDDVLEGLRPHSSLEFLEIHGFMGVKYPSWLLLVNNMKEIELLGCNKCEGVPVLGHLPNLSCVKIKRMEKLTHIGSEFYGDSHVNYGNGSSNEVRPLFPALKTLHIEEARNLIEWMEAPTERGSRVVFPCLEKLTLIHCDQLTSAPIYFPSLKRLVILYMHSGGMPIASILSNQLTTLTYLSLGYVRGLTCLPEGVLENNKNLADLDIWDCSELTHISEGFEYCCTSLSYLRIWNCEILRYVPAGLLTPSLQELRLCHCDNLEYIPDATHGGLTSLETLLVMGCFKITSIPFSQGLPSLDVLIIQSCPELSCRKLTCLPDGLAASSQSCSLTRLKELTIGSFSEQLDAFPAFQAIRQLESLTMYGWRKLKSLPEQIQHLPSLRHLEIEAFKEVEAIPEWLGNLASLEDLTVRFCWSLKYLPSVEAMQRLTKLKEIAIYFCPLLEERCREESCPEWPKICHLPFIKIGNITIEN